MMQVACAFLVVTATLASAAVSAETDAGSEIAPSESAAAGPVGAPEAVSRDQAAEAEAVSSSPLAHQAAEPAASPSPLPDEAAPGTQPLADSAPSPDHGRANPVEAVPAKSETPPATAAAPVASSAPTLARRPSATREAPGRAGLTIVNGRAITATSVAVLVGAKVVRRSGPLASRTRVTLNLPRSIGCRVSVVASFPWGYSSLRSGKVDVCKVGQALVRL
jgi:hypothetical protein